MKAMVYTEYGSPDVLELKEIEKPSANNNEVLIKVSTKTVSQADAHFRSGTPFLARQMAGGFQRPKITILGFDFAGEVESVGKECNRLKKGDKVYGFMPFGINGANTEYVCVPEEHALIKPINMTYEEAAAVPLAATVALRFLQAGSIKSGQKVLINGASGGLGTFAVQLAKSFDAEVTAVCSTGNLDMVKSLGADKVIDYTKKDFTESNNTYDLIFDAVGKSSFSKCRKLLNQKGFYITTLLTFKILLDMLWTSVIGGKKAKFATPMVTPKDLDFINNLIKAGKIKPILDRSYPLSQLAEAHRYVELGHVKGRVVINIAD